MENWINITSNEEVKQIVEKSHETTQIIFKDSVTCGISAYAKSRLVDGNEILKGKADFNYLDLLTYRSVSDFIAKFLEVVHQSPQILLVKDGEFRGTCATNNPMVKNNFGDCTVCGKKADEVCKMPEVKKS